MTPSDLQELAEEILDLEVDIAYMSHLARIFEPAPDPDKETAS